MDSVGEILKLKPSLVIGSVPYKQDTLAKLLEHPLSFLATNPRSLADIANDICILGRIAGRPEQAEQLAIKMRRELALIAKKARTTKRKWRVYCEAWPSPRISSPPWVAELVNFCGGEMLVPAGQKVSDEQVADARPDVIVLAWAATGARAKPSKTYQVARWKDLPAVRNKRVYVVRDELLNTPGPPLLEGANELLRIFQKMASQKAPA
jgi:iron complex transport system substrate-binding protein